MGLNKGYLTAKTDKASDETFTPIYAITPLLEFIKPNSTIWCPFDEPDSKYIEVFKENGYKVIHSHINEDKNFFFYEPEEDYDVIISNPPFSIKDEILKRLYELDKPYAVLMPIPALQSQKRFPYIKDCEALIFDKRVEYYRDKQYKETQKGVSFGSFYLCRRFLPERLIFRELIKK